MERLKLNSILKEEPEHIPRGLRGEDQNFLSALYNMIRRHHLGVDEKAPARRALEEAIAAVNRDNPEFLPKYNKDFFPRK